MSKVDLKGRDFLKLLDYTPEEILYLVDLAAEYKEMKKKGKLHDSLHGKNVALIFEKTSTRTRCSFEVAAHDLGMGTTYLDPTGSQIALRIRQGCLQVCMTELSTADLTSLSWKNLRSIPKCLYGTD